MRTFSKKAAISLDFRLMDVHGLATFADGTVVGLTNNAKFPQPTVVLANVTAQAVVLRATSALRSSGDRSSALTRQEGKQADTLMTSLTSNGHYVVDTANALFPGDLAGAEQLILTTGYVLKGHPTPATRGFEIVATGPTWVHVRVKKANPGNEGHMWRYGITATNGTAPTTLVTRFSLNADIIFSDLPNNGIVGVQHASILPVPRVAAGGAVPAKGKSLAAHSTSGHVMVSHTVVDPYVWTGFIYKTVA